MKQFKICVLILFLAACGQHAAEEATEQQQHAPEPPAGWYYAEGARPFDPVRFIPELMADTGFHFISSLQYGNHYQHTIFYCIYRMDKQRVLNILNGQRIPSYIKANGDTVYARCEKVDTSYFFSRIFNEREGGITPQNYFYGFR